MKYLLGTASLGILLFLGGAFFFGSQTLHDLLGENRELKEAISNLTTSETIGHAKVVNQHTDADGVLRTTLRFVEIDRDKQTVILRKEFTVEGDVVFFDGMVVIFPGEMVMDGKERAIHLWRRVFGENMNPSEGFMIETTGEEPGRYREVFKRLGQQEKRMFWTAMWDLSNDSKALQEHGVKAIYGDALSIRMKRGLVYTFTLGNDGQVTVETSPDI